MYETLALVINGRGVAEQANRPERIPLNLFDYIIIAKQVAHTQEHTQAVLQLSRRAESNLYGCCATLRQPSAGSTTI